MKALYERVMALQAQVVAVAAAKLGVLAERLLEDTYVSVKHEISREGDKFSVDSDHPEWTEMEERRCTWGILGPLSAASLEELTAKVEKLDVEALAARLVDNAIIDED